MSAHRHMIRASTPAQERVVSARSEKRRVKRDRRLTVQAGQGHGDRMYRPVLVTNRMVTVAQREARRIALGARDVRRQEYAATLKKRAAARVAANLQREPFTPAGPVVLGGRLGPRRKWRPVDELGRAITGGAGGFHLPQRDGRFSYLAPRPKAKRGRRAAA